MSNASATGASMSSDHLLALRERETIASVLARGATQDLVVNGSLDRVWMFCDAFRLSDALGYGPAFAFTYHFLREIGIRNPGELPDPEVWKAICDKPYVAKLSAETTARLDGKAAFVAALLSGRLEFPYGNMPPLSPDNFERTAEILRGNLAARLGEREVLAKLDDVKLHQFVETVSLGREEDAAKVDGVRQLFLDAIAKRHEELIGALRAKLHSRRIPDYHNPRAFTDIRLNEVFDRWWNDLGGDLLKIAVKHGARGQSDPFEVPPYRSAILSDIEWKGVPWRLPRSSMGHGAYYTGMGTGVGAAGGAASSGINAYATGALTMAKYPAALKAIGFSTAVGGAGLGVVAFLAWMGLKYWRGSATAAYEVFVRGLVTEIEAALAEDVMECYRAYAGRTTHADNLKAQNALAAQMKLAGDRLVAANTYAQPQSRDRLRAV